MARAAIVIEVARNVVRVRRLCKPSLVALIAIGKHELIVAVDVTRLALRGGVRPRQRKVCGVVIECRRSPRARCVTHRALMWEIERLVVRVRCAIEVRSMAIVTRRRQALVHVVHMTLHARCSLVGTCQREARVIVVERRWLPCRRRMTGTAIVIEISRNMVRVRRLSKLYLMTLVAIVKHKLIVAIDMA